MVGSDVDLTKLTAAIRTQNGQNVFRSTQIRWQKKSWTEKEVIAPIIGVSIGERYVAPR